METRKLNEMVGRHSCLEKVEVFGKKVKFPCLHGESEATKGPQVLE